MMLDRQGTSSVCDKLAHPHQVFPLRTRGAAEMHAPARCLLSWHERRKRLASAESVLTKRGICSFIIVKLSCKATYFARHWCVWSMPTTVHVSYCCLSALRASSFTDFPSKRSCKKQHSLRDIPAALQRFFHSVNQLLVRFCVLWHEPKLWGGHAPHRAQSVTSSS